jgi:hypothetical protein
MHVAALMSLGADSRPPLAPARPKCNSILHMFGEWLFEAAHIGSEAAYCGKGHLQSKFIRFREFHLTQHCFNSYYFILLFYYYYYFILFYDRNM